MENSPRDYEDDEEEESSAKDSKKTRLGLFAISNETPDKEKDASSWFSRLTESKPEDDEKPKEETEAEAEPEPKPKLELVETVEEKPIIAEVEPVSEIEAPLEEPSEKELAEVVRPKLVEVIEEIEADQESDPITDPPVDKFRDLVKSGEEPDAAFDEVMAEMDIEESEVAELDSDEPKEVAEEEPDKESIEVEEDEIESEVEDEPDTVEAIEAELDMEEEPEAPEDPSTDTSSTTPPVVPPPPPPTANIPPSPPFTPPPPGFQPPFGGPQQGGNTPNTPPPTPSQNQNIQPNAPEYHQASPAAMALFGGIVGYLIGRRRGRIKAEKQLLPVQKKLEKQVEDMQFELEEKEKKIRRIAAAKVEKDGPQVIESFKKKQKTEQQPDNDQEQVQTPEISILQVPQSKPEHLGHMMVKAESTPEAKPAATLDKIIDPENMSRTSQQLETLNRTELLAMSEKIIIDGSSLRQIFETHLIGERGLRRIIAEQMRGGDLKKALQMEIVEREIDFERDPGANDLKPPQAAKAPADIGGSGSSQALNQMLEKASASIGGNEEAAFIRARAAYEADQTNRQLKQRRVIDISFAVIIAILVGMVIFLIISRM